MKAKSLFTVAAALGAYGAYRYAALAMRRYDFQGRTVVITGGSRGLGLNLARQLVDEGARLAVCARHADELERAAHELRGRGGVVLAEPCDVTDADCVRRFFAHVRSQLGPVDVLINNAGIIQVGPLESMTPADFDEAMAIHFAAPLATMREAIPDMRRRGHGRIVNIASIGGQIAVPHLAPYCASKFALVGLSQGFQAELAGDGVYVTTVCPGLMRTGSHRRALFSGQHQAEYAWFSHGASAPLLAMSADRAARQILSACRHGRARITLSLPAKAAVVLDALAPELKAELSALAARVLPGPGGVGAAKVEGRDSTSRWSPSWATLLGERAALENNEFSADELAPPHG